MPFGGVIPARRAFLGLRKFPAPQLNFSNVAPRKEAVPRLGDIKFLIGQGRARRRQTKISLAGASRRRKLQNLTAALAIAILPAA
jgi:hypothetical protein